MDFQSWVSSNDTAYLSSQVDNQFSSHYHHHHHHRLGVFDSFDRVLRGGLLPDFDTGNAVPTVVVRDGRKKPMVAAAETKATMALKNHRDAERRRRGKINAHLDTLRGLMPCTDKMDKAALLAQVIKQVKELKKQSTEASKGFLVPTDTDEVHVEQLETRDGEFTYMASICCSYRPDLLPDLKQAIDDLHLITTRAEISTLGDHVKSVFVFTTYNDNNRSNVDHEVPLDIANSIRQALNSVLDKASTSLEYSPRISAMNKRRKVSYNDSMNSSF